MGISYVYVKIDIQFHLPRFGGTKIDEWIVWVLIPFPPLYQLEVGIIATSTLPTNGGSKIVESIWTS
jgi:hypothetical protein